MVIILAVELVVVVLMTIASWRNRRGWEREIEHTLRLTRALNESHAKNARDNDLWRERCDGLRAELWALKKGASL